VHPYYFDSDPARTRRDVAILTFNRPAPRRGWSPPRPPRRGSIEIPRQAVALVRLWLRRGRERRELARLDYRMLRDIGVTPSDAMAETEKPFWQE
jgi:uncharacterized protein YjiS (DUF1127 family)